MSNADNGYMFGGADGNAVNVTAGGNVSASVIYDHPENVGKVVLRNNQLYPLPDCPCAKIKLYALSSNRGNLWIGGINDQSAQPNVGLPIVAGAKFEPYCTNSNMFTVIADADGDGFTLVIYATVQANATNITPQNDPPIDVTVPAVTSTVPINGAPNQSMNVQISFMMNVPIDPNSVTTTNITSIPTIPGYQVTVDSANPKHILVLYSGLLQATSNYTFYIQGLTSLYGYVMASQYTFNFGTSNTTAPPDLTPPTIVSYSPTNGSTNVVVTTQPTFTFSQPILPSSINTTSIELTDVDTTSFVTGVTFNQSTDLKTITMIPPSLDGGVNYRIDIWNTNTPGQGIEDTNGVYLDHTYSISFTTKIPYTIVYSVAGNAYLTMYNGSGAVIYAGIFLSDTSSLIGKVPLYFSFTLRKVGSPPGNFVINWNRQSGTRVISIASVVANSLSTSDTTLSYNFFSNTQQFQSGDFINIEYTSGNSSNYIQSKFSTTGVFNGTATYLVDRFYGTSADDYSTTTDFGGVIGVAS